MTKKKFNYFVPLAVITILNLLVCSPILAARIDLMSPIYTVKVVHGKDHTCALSNVGSVKCWGYNVRGVLGQPYVDYAGREPNTMGSQLSAIKLGKNFVVKDMCAGGGFNCALSADHKVKCWGDNSSRALGQEHSMVSFGDLEIQLGEHLPFSNLGDDFKPEQISCGEGHVCALSGQGTGKCWGSNYSGELGISTAVKTIGGQPGEMGANLKTLPFTKPIKKLATARESTCAMFDDEVICWGNNSYGQIGIERFGSTITINETGGDAKKTVKLEDSRTSIQMIDVSAGATSFCALYRVFRLATERMSATSTQKLKCWGLNDVGQAGAGVLSLSVGDSPGSMGAGLPAVDLQLGELRKVEAHNRYACAFSNKGQTKCWGNNHSGELGLEDNVYRGRFHSEMGDKLPTIDLELPVIGLSSGISEHSCAILVNHEVKCWGHGNTGALGYESADSIGLKEHDMGFNLKSVHIW